MDPTPSAKRTSTVGNPTLRRAPRRGRGSVTTAGRGCLPCRTVLDHAARTVITVVQQVWPGEVVSIGPRLPWPGVDELFLVGREERLGDGIIEAGGAATHGAAHDPPR